VINRIVVVCKYNQARSIAAAAALRKFFPNLKIISAGIQANPLTPIPSTILDILDQWDLDKVDPRSTKFSEIQDLGEGDLILCADLEVRRIVEQDLINKIDSKSEICILEEFAKTEFEIPVDPVSMDEADTKTQLARCIVLAIRGVRKHLLLSPPISGSYLPRDKSEHLQYQRFLRDLIQQNQGAIIDTGFSIPNKFLWEINGTDLMYINPNRIDESEISSKTPTIVLSKFEVDFTPRIFLSTYYYDWLIRESSTRPVYCLAQPVSEFPRNRFHEMVLGQIHS